MEDPGHDLGTLDDSRAGAHDVGVGVEGPHLGVGGDVAGIDFSPIGKVDCMIGGPPCQDFSITRGGKRSGINPASNVKKKAEVSRGRLYMEYVRAVK
ncbi:MAG: DNA cytosine methyltransferase, partial [Actinomycetota bacterium]